MDRPTGNLCKATNRDGQPCGNAAGKGTDHVGFGNCKNHGGSSPNGKKHAESLRETWLEAIAAEVDPSIRKIAELRESAKQESVQLAAARDMLDRNDVKAREDAGEQVVKIVVDLSNLD